MKTSGLVYVKNLEYTRGILTTVLTNVFSQGLVYLTSTTNIKHKEIMIYVVTFIVANLLSFTADILIAKRDFDGKLIDIDDTNFRVKYLIDKLFSYQIVKFFILVAIDFMIVKAIYDKSTRVLDDKDIKFTHRDQILLFTITGFTFLLYGNMLRFKWVYQDSDQYLIDTLMIIWLSLMFFISTRCNKI